MLVVRNPPAKAGDAKDSGLSPRLGRSPEVGNGNLLQYTCLQCLATHSSILARKKVMNRGAWWLQSMGLQTVRHNWAHTHTHTHTHTQLRGGSLLLFPGSFLYHSWRTEVHFAPLNLCTCCSFPCDALPCFFNQPARSQPSAPGLHATTSQRTAQIILCKFQWLTIWHSW